MAVVFNDYTICVRADLVAVGKAVALANTLLGIDELVYLCTSLCPALSGSFLASLFCCTLHSRFCIIRLR